MGRARFRRINKRIARKWFEEGKAFYMVPHKLRPGGPFGMGMMIFPAGEKREGRTFDEIVNNFVYYNCGHNEVGYYPAFYEEV